MKKVKVGLLPMYVLLYDEVLPWMHPQVDEFYENVAKKLESEGVEVLRAPVCRLEDEFRSSIQGFEAAGADVLFTLHLAYSPSLQSEKPLKECKLPIVVLDTTPDYDFRPEGDAGRLDFNHGIHGVQDMCNLMIRNKVKFEIFTGHWAYSDVCKQAADYARAICAAEALSHAKVGLIGEPFAGMGDFRVPFEDMKKEIGIEVVQTPTAVIGGYTEKVTEDRIAALWEEDEKRFTNHEVTREKYDEVTRVSLAVKDWYEAEGMDAFTLNFLSAGKTTGLGHMVFDRACRAMEEGVGYAGEGDVLTAALVGALLKSWEETTFVEMFCPNWQNGVVFLCHMGEYNLRIAGRRPLMINRPFSFTDTGDPYALMSCMKAGKATLINLAPQGDGKYKLIAISGEMQQVPEQNGFERVVNGWFKPDHDLADTLKIYSKHGGTHHSAMVYGADASAFSAMADRFGWEFVII